MRLVALIIRSTVFRRILILHDLHLADYFSSIVPRLIGNIIAQRIGIGRVGINFTYESNFADRTDIIGCRCALLAINAAEWQGHVR
ncbi:hypothetical protein D3C85_1380970 [compost metagenome]